MNPICEARRLCDALNAYKANGGADTWDDVIWKDSAVDVAATNNCPRLFAAVVYMTDGSRALYDTFEKTWAVEVGAAEQMPVPQ